MNTLITAYNNWKVYAFFPKKKKKNYFQNTKQFVSCHEHTISLVNSSTETAYLPQKGFFLREIPRGMEKETKESWDTLKLLMSLQVYKKPWIWKVRRHNILIK